MQALSAGAVPPIGLKHIQVGRVQEVQAVLDDLDRAKEGLSTVRFACGPAESGKTFFLNLVRTEAIARGFVVASAAITTSQLLCGTAGEARVLYGALLSGLATPDAPDGVSLGTLIQHWMKSLSQPCDGAGAQPDLSSQVAKALDPLFGDGRGFDFTTVLTRYCEACMSHDVELQGNALRWLRAEYTSVAVAHDDLGVGSIIDDAGFCEAISLLSAFVQVLGYAGLLVTIDELDHLSHRVRDAHARAANFDVVSRLMDGCLQGRIEGLVVLFGVETESLDDRQRGLRSHDLLAKRLAPNRFAVNGHPDLSLPVIRLKSLSRGDYPALLASIRNVFAGGDHARCRLPDDGISAYLEACNERLGARFVHAPCETVKDFIGLLRVLEQDPQAGWRDIIESAEMTAPVAPGLDIGAPDPDLAGHFEVPVPHATRGSSRPRFNTRVAAAIALPVLLLLVAMMVKAMFFPAVAALDGAVEVKISEIRNGVRVSLRPEYLPVRTGHFFSAEVNLNQPGYVYVMVVDSSGHVAWLHGNQNEQHLGTHWQLPGGSKMWALTEPIGMRTVVMLATRTPAADPAALKTTLESLRPLPRPKNNEMFVLSERGLEYKQRAATSPSGAPATIPDAGFLDALAQTFGERFEVVRAVSFPLVGLEAPQGSLLYDPTG